VLLGQDGADEADQGVAGGEGRGRRSGGISVHGLLRLLDGEPLIATSVKAVRSAPCRRPSPPSVASGGDIMAAP
jgi:hypothetical protein